MKHQTLLLFTRTPLHVGSGGSVGAVDQPVQRERHTRHPIIPGTSIKGVLRYTHASIDKKSDDEVDSLFGKMDSAGDISIGEARPLAFPIRSAKGAFAFVTCPLALQRFARDSGKDIGDLPSSIEDQTCYAGSKVVIPTKKKVVLEEYAFDVIDDFPAAAIDAVADIIDDPVWRSARGRFVLLSDGDFTHFVGNTCEISHHNRIDPTTGTVAKGALFNLESVPAETLFYASVTHVGRREDSMQSLSDLIDAHPVLQFGGNSTTGRGFCSLSLTS